MHRLGVLLCRSGRTDEGTSWLRQNCSLAPDSAEAWHDLGIASAISGSGEDAAIAFRRAVTIRPDFVEAWNNLGGTLLRLGKRNEADAAYRAATEVIRADRTRYRPPEIEVIRGEAWSRDDQPRILLLKLDHIGDFITSLDAFGLIRNTWPKAHITLVCAPWNRPLAERSGLFDTILSCDFLPESGADFDPEAVIPAGIVNFLALPLGSYDLAVDLRYSADTRALLLCTDAKYRAGYNAEIGLDLALPPVPEVGKAVHSGARVLTLAAAVVATFAPANGQAPEILMGGRPAIRSFPDGTVVGIAPGTGNPIKAWGRERFTELARRLHRESGSKFVLIGGARENPDSRFIAGSVPEAEWKDLTGTLGMTDLPPVIAGLDLFIGNDTGTTHLAALLGVPTVCIFAGQPHIHSWRPLGRHVVTLRANVECSPCYLPRIEHCPRGHLCVDIPPSRVAAEALALLKTTDSER